MGTHQAANRTAWTGFAPRYAEAAERHWAATELTWGTVGSPVWSRRWPPEEVWAARLRA